MLRTQRPCGMLGDVAALCLAALVTTASWRAAEAKPPGLPDGQLQPVPGCMCRARSCCPAKHHNNDTFRRAFDKNFAYEGVGTKIGEEVWKPACSLLNALHGQKDKHRMAENGFLGDLCGERRLRRFRHADLCSYLYDGDMAEAIDWGRSNSPRVGLIVDSGNCERLSIMGSQCWDTEENQTWMAQWIEMGREVEEKGVCPSSTYFNTTNGSALGVGMHCLRNSTTRGMRVTMKWMHPTDQTMRTQAACNLAGDFDEVIGTNDWWGSYMPGPKFMCIDIPTGPNGAQYRAMIYALGDPPCDELYTTSGEPELPLDEEQREEIDLDEVEDKDLVIDGKSLHDLIVEAVMAVDDSGYSANVTPTRHNVTSVQSASAKPPAKKVNSTPAMNTTNSSKTNTTRSIPNRWREIAERKQRYRQDALETEKRRQR